MLNVCREVMSKGENVQGGIFPEGNISRGERVQGGMCPGGPVSGWNMSGGQLSRGESGRHPKRIYFANDCFLFHRFLVFK